MSGKSSKRKDPSKQSLLRSLLLHRMTNRIRESLDLQTILEATVAEIRSFLETDRVKIYRFDADGAGQVIAESVNAKRLPSLRSLHFPAGDIPPTSRELFVKARQRSIIDVPSQAMILSRLDNPEAAHTLTLADLDSNPIQDLLRRPVDPCHVAYLTAMGVQSSLVVPILTNQTLWGLLVSHHAQPRAFSEEDLQVVQILSDQVAIAIGQSTLLSQTQAKARREALINRISTILHSPLNTQQILQIVLETVMQAMRASGGRLYLTPMSDSACGSLYLCGQQPALEEVSGSALLEEFPFWQQLMFQEGRYQEGSVALENLWQQTLSDPWVEPLLDAQGRLTTIYLSPGVENWNTPLRDWLEMSDLKPESWAIADLYQDPRLAPLWPAFEPTSLRSLLIMPLHYRQQCLGCLTLFRDAVDTDILWAGYLDPDDRQDRARQSFEAWREIKRNQASPWTSEEIELIQAVGTHVAMAVMQSRLYQCEREHRILVEMRNRELNTARTVAEEASRLKSDFLSSTSHELRTPLSSTLNYLKLLKEGFYDDEAELKEYIQVAHQSAENLVAIINDVLDIAKIEAGRMNLHLEQVDLKALMEEQCKLFRLDSRSKGIPLQMVCGVEQVYADKIKLRQVLANLLSNAFKFTSDGEVCISAMRLQGDPPRVAIAVADTGIGLDEKQQELVFEPFVQADGSIKRRYGGTGLGLTVCKRLVELMGGYIWIESPGENQGTTVTFILSESGSLWDSNHA